LVKIFRTIGTQLETEQYAKLKQICQEQGYKPYAIIKDLLHQYIESYEDALIEETEKKSA
jgi:hypothetical protein